MPTGPALAGVTIAGWGFSGAYAAQALALAVALLAVVRLPAMRPEGIDAAGGGSRTEHGGLLVVVRCLTLWGSMATDLSATLLAMPIALFPDARRGRVSSVEHVIGVAGPELGNFRGGLVASATSASFSLVSGGLSAVLAIGAVYAANAPLRDYRTPTAPEKPSVPEPLAPAEVTIE
ncbi:hypothetical protein ACIP6I_31020 [Streptomyces anulatus]